MVIGAIPRPADEDFWNDPLAMNLLFDVKYPVASREMFTDVVSAKLRLYKISQVCSKKLATKKPFKKKFGTWDFRQIPEIWVFGKKRMGICCEKISIRIIR